MRGGLLCEGLLVLQACRLGLRLLPLLPLQGLPTRLSPWSRTGGGGRGGARGRGGAGGGLVEGRRRGCCGGGCGTVVGRGPAPGGLCRLILGRRLGGMLRVRLSGLEGRGGGSESGTPGRVGLAEL